jgi:hypothetical protein
MYSSVTGLSTQASLTVLQERLLAPEDFWAAGGRNQAGVGLVAADYPLISHAMRRCIDSLEIGASHLAANCQTQILGCQIRTGIRVAKS